MKPENTDKITRILDIYSELMNGGLVEKEKKAQYYDVNERSIERDISDIRDFINREENNSGTIVFDKRLRGYRIEQPSAGCKPTVVVDTMGEIAEAIHQYRYLIISYQQMDGSITYAKIKPIAIMYSEGQFYMAAFQGEESENVSNRYPSMYRINSILEAQSLDDMFRIPFGCKFEEGNFKQQISFLYGGMLHRVKFRCSGDLTDEVMRQFPTARMIQKKGGVRIWETEVLGGELDAWVKEHSGKAEQLE